MARKTNTTTTTDSSVEDLKTAKAEAHTALVPLVEKYRKAKADREASEASETLAFGEVGTVLAAMRPRFGTSKTASADWLAWCKAETGFEKASVYRAVQVSTVVAREGEAIVTRLASRESVAACASLDGDQTKAALAEAAEAAGPGGDLTKAIVTAAVRKIRDGDDGETEAERDRKKTKRIAEKIAPEIAKRAKASGLDLKAFYSAVAFGADLGGMHGEKTSDAVQGLWRTIAQDQAREARKTKAETKAAAK